MKTAERLTGKCLYKTYVCLGTVLLCLFSLLLIKTALLYGCSGGKLKHVRESTISMLLPFLVRVLCEGLVEIGRHRSFTQMQLRHVVLLALVAFLEAAKGGCTYRAKL